MLLDWLKRKKQAKGYGIHSPFAYELITRVIKEEHGYTAFSVIEEILRENNIEPGNKKLNHLSYRLVSYFKPGKILELETGQEVNTLYISAASKDAVCHCFDPDGKNVLLARNLHTTFSNRVTFIDEIDISESYDAIFVYLDSFPIDMENLLEMSSGNTFWVISGIKTCSGKRFWAAITADERARITFDLNGIGIVILDKSHHKANYML